jgi:hypothetical protein
MGVRKNVKFLTATERENFVKACVLMKADIVNPMAPAADQYSRWDELVALHRMIQNVNVDPPNPANNVNFGHGGLGSYSFLSWHRYFLHRLEVQLRGYLPVDTPFDLPYWDWTDLSPVMVPTFLGPDGDAGTNVVSQGYFAPSKPGTGGNLTVLPGWWPASLDGWNLHSAFGVWAGALTRNLSGLAGLPSVADMTATLARATYSTFQNTVESGAGLASGHQMHNGLHGWIGGHMSNPTASPFDPIFYLHHCNIDRLWAMWQLDGHATTYPAAGAKPKHAPTDAMYPWVGADTPLYHTNIAFGPIAMPDFTALGPVLNQDTLDFRTQYGYTYDTLAVIGVGLDRTGSMNGLTPDPMTGMGSVTKWEAATRGVSAFLQDCETVQTSGAIYVTAGVKTFRSLPANDFAPVFAGTPYGLVKTGTPYSKSAFDTAAAGMSPGGGTPLADALNDVENTLVEPPFGWVPPEEQRYLAMLTDGMLTSGAPLASIPDGAFPNTAIFALGFGTPAEVDYTTLASMVAKGKTLGFSQVFHGENAGVIDKFYSNALAKAIGFTTIFDPVIEMYAGEHTHVEFYATSAEERFFITAQGMDFEDSNWSYHLEAPDGTVIWGDMAHGHAGPAAHGRLPHVTARRGDGRLSLMLQRDSAPASTWVGRWNLMISYRARDLSAMLMLDISELMIPVAAGPVRGPRHARLLQRQEKRFATPSRAIAGVQRHALDVRAAETNNSGNESATIVVNIYAASRLRLELVPAKDVVERGDKIKIDVRPDVLSGTISSTRSFARLIAPAVDLADLVARVKPKDVPKEAELRGSIALKFDPARLLAQLEAREPKLAEVRDEAVAVAVHGGLAHIHLDESGISGVQHLGVYIDGSYCPEHSTAGAGHDHAHDAGGMHEHAAPAGAADVCGPDCKCERFTRLLNASVGVAVRK